MTKEIELRARRAVASLATRPSANTKRYVKRCSCKREKRSTLRLSAKQKESKKLKDPTTTQNHLATRRGRMLQQLHLKAPSQQASCPSGSNRVYNSGRPWQPPSRKVRQRAGTAEGRQTSTLACRCRQRHTTTECSAITATGSSTKRLPSVTFRCARASSKPTRSRWEEASPKGSQPKSTEQASDEPAVLVSPLR